MGAGRRMTGRTRTRPIRAMLSRLVMPPTRRPAEIGPAVDAAGEQYAEQAQPPRLPRRSKHPRRSSPAHSAPPGATDIVTGDKI